MTMTPYEADIPMMNIVRQDFIDEFCAWWPTTYKALLPLMLEVGKYHKLKNEIERRMAREFCQYQKTRLAAREVELHHAELDSIYKRIHKERSRRLKSGGIPKESLILPLDMLVGKAIRHRDKLENQIGRIGPAGDPYGKNPTLDTQTIVVATNKTNVDIAAALAELEKEVGEKIGS